MAYNVNQFQRSYGVDPLRESGLLKNQANNTMYAVALALPAHYKELRTNLEIKITHDLVKRLYTVVFAALRDGKSYMGEDLVPLIGQEFERFKQKGRGNAFRPDIPESRVNEIAYECATALIQLLQDKIVDEIMPVNLGNIANEKIATRTTMKLAAGEYNK